MLTKNWANDRALIAVIVVAALGYFVDIYDLLLFSIVRVKSLREMGIPDEQLMSVGGTLLSDQMWGMLFGGVLWGILGDKRGRLSVLFGSILIYSIANILNGLVETVESYRWLRFFAGLGLAGELGAGITLVSEMMQRERRGYGTTIVATVGILGAVVAYFVSQLWDWRTAYFVGGGMGLALLILRVSVYESGMFNSVKKTDVQRGQFLSLFTNAANFRKYAQCILIGTPTWFVMGILVAFSKEFSEALGVSDGVADPGRAVMWAYTGLTLGDLSSGLLSQWLRSRKKSMLIFHLLSAATIALYLSTSGGTLGSFYTKILLMGYGVGYWAIFVTIGSEQFGTNLRATVTTTVPNFARGMLPLIIMAFTALRATNGLIGAAVIIGCVTVGIALTALYFIPETFGKDLDYTE